MWNETENVFILPFFLHNKMHYNITRRDKFHVSSTTIKAQLMEFIGSKLQIYFDVQYLAHFQMLMIITRGVNENKTFRGIFSFSGPKAVYHRKF